MKKEKEGGEKNGTAGDFFTGANLRDTYDTIHHVRKAQALSVGQGVKVGIIDWLFACDHYPALYAGCADISGEPALLRQADGHGRWMAETIREIAPGCCIFAINGVVYDEARPGEEDRLPGKSGGLGDRSRAWRC